MAKQVAPQAIKKRGLQELLEEYSTEEIIKSLENNGNYRIGDIFPFTNMSLSLSPIYSGDEMVGVLAVILHPEESFLPMNTLSKSRQVFTQQMRQNLHQIFSVTETASMKADILNSNWIDQHLEKINFSSYNLLRVTDNISVYSLLQNGLLILNYSAVPLVQWFQSIKDTVSSLAEKNNIPVFFHLSKDEIIVTIDLYYFQILFFNILHNSIYFTKENNEIHISLSQQKDNIKILVKDRGMGMSPEIIEKAFLPFYTYSTMGHGVSVGLGLTLAKRLTQLHGGLISLDSNEEETTVELTFPSTKFSEKISFSQNENPGNILDRFSPLYIGLTSALESPYKE